PGIYGDRQCSPDFAAPRDWPIALGLENARRAEQQLRQHVGANRCEGPGDRRNLRRRPGNSWFSFGIQSYNRRARLAFLDGPEARRTAVGDLEGQRPREWRRWRGYVDDGNLRCGDGHFVLGRGQSLPGHRRRRAAGRQLIYSIG